MRLAAAAVVAALVWAAQAQAQTACQTPPADQPLTLSRPVAGSIMREFGNVWSDALQAKAFNKGIDLEAQPGEPVYAAANGSVVSVEQGSAGLAVRIGHGGGVETVYAGIGSASLHQGACVKGGEQIGVAGSDAKTAGVVHFELHRGGEAVDPTGYLQ